MAYINNINNKENDCAINIINNIYINTESAGSDKTIDFSLYGYDGNIDENLVFKIIFKNGHITTTDTDMLLNNKPILIYKYHDGAFGFYNLKRYQITSNSTTSTNLYTTLQAGVSLNLYYDSNEDAFIIIGNPIVYSDEKFKIYADETIEHEKYYKLTDFVNESTPSSDIYWNSTSTLNVNIDIYGSLLNGEELFVEFNKFIYSNSGIPITNFTITCIDRLNNNNQIVRHVKSNRNNKWVDLESFIVWSHISQDENSYHNKFVDRGSILKLTYFSEILDLTNYGIWYVDSNTVMMSYKKIDNDGYTLMTTHNYIIYANGLINAWGNFPVIDGGDRFLYFGVKFINGDNYTFIDGMGSSNDNDHDSGGYERWYYILEKNSSNIKINFPYTTPTNLAWNVVGYQNYL